MARGSVRPIQRKGKDGKSYTVYRARVPAGETGDGKRRQRTKVCRTRKEADAWVSDQLAKIARGDVAAERLTVGELLDRWLPLHARDVTSNTAYSDRWAATRIREALGSLDVAKCSVLTLQRFYDGLDGYAPTSVKVVHRVLRHALDQAVAWELIARNPATATRRPAVVPAKRDVWTATQVQAFLAGTRDHFDGPLFALILSTGLRIGEALALDWEHVDLDAGRLTVARTMTRKATGKAVLGDKAKSRTSHRTLRLPLLAQAALRRQRDAQAARRDAAGAGWLGTGAVFDRGDGLRRTAEAARRQLMRMSAACGLPYLGPHGLRHSAGTILFKRKVSPALIQDMLGHSSVEVTTNLYLHRDEADRDEVADAMDEALSDGEAEAGTG